MISRPERRGGEPGCPEPGSPPPRPTGFRPGYEPSWLIPPCRRIVVRAEDLLVPSARASRGRRRVGQPPARGDALSRLQAFGRLHQQVDLADPDALATDHEAKGAAHALRMRRPGRSTCECPAASKSAGVARENPSPSCPAWQADSNATSAGEMVERCPLCQPHRTGRYGVAAGAGNCIVKGLAPGNGRGSPYPVNPRLRRSVHGYP